MEPRVIGIDPGIENGVARWDPKEMEFIDIRALEFWELITFLAKHDPAHTLVICEDPSLNAPVWGAEKILATPGGHKSLSRKAQNVGSNKRTANLIVEYLRLYRFAHVAKRPLKRVQIPSHYKTKAGKLSGYGFQELTGCSWKCNEHERDAAMLVYNLPMLTYLAHIQNR